MMIAITVSARVRKVYDELHVARPLLPGHPAGDALLLPTAHLGRPSHGSGPAPCGWGHGPGPRRGERRTIIERDGDDYRLDQPVGRRVWFERAELAGLVLTLIFGPSLAHAQSPALARAAVVAATIAQGADTMTTVSALNRGGTEANPILPQRPAAILATKAIVAGINGVVSWRYARRHPRLVSIANAALGAVSVWAVVHNRGQARH